MNGKWTSRSEVDQWYQKVRDINFKNYDGYDLFLLEMHCELIFGAVQMIESNMHRVVDENLLNCIDRLSQNVITEIDTFYEYLQMAIDDVMQGE